MNSIRTNFSELLAAFSSDDSWTILSAFLMTFIIAWLMRYLWDRSKIKTLEDGEKKSKEEKLHFKGQWEKLQDKYALQEADLKKVSLELSDKTVKLETSDAEKRALNSRLTATLLDLDKSKDEFQEASNRMEDLNDQILGLRTKNAQLNTEMEQKTKLASQYAVSSTAPSEEVVNLAAENALLKTSIEALKANKGAEGTAGATLRLTELEDENESLKKQLAAKSAEIAIDSYPQNEQQDDYLAEIAQLEGGNEALNTTIINLIEENEQLKTQLADLPQYEAGNEALNNSIHTLIVENEALQTDKSRLIQYEAGNEVLNSTIADLIIKNEALTQELTEKEQNQVEWVGTEDSFNDEDNEVEEMGIDEAKAKLRASIGEQIARAAPEERDDLKLINGIGPFIEEKLNDLGIYTFEQISQLDEEMVNTLTTAIEFFPGRIDKDDWVGQADRLFYTRGSAPQEMDGNLTKIVTRRYATATEKIDAKPITRKAENIKSDDLKKIEGIGPKIAQLLNDAGIYTFSNLSQTPVKRLEVILENAGNRFKMHSPKTWPQQAELAANGEWGKLQILQDQLDGGRDVAKG